MFSILSLLLFVSLLCVSQAHAACKTSFLPVKGNTSPPRYFICDAYADRPTSGLNAGDQLFAIASANTYIATNATTWVQTNGGGSGSGDITAVGS